MSESNRPAYYGWNYGYYNDRECFPITGPGIEAADDMRFATPARAEHVARLFQRAYELGVQHGKAQVREAMGIKP